MRDVQVPEKMNNSIIIPGDVGEVSDGYHTFNELYDHRMLLFCALVSSNKHLAWKSIKHSDGTILGDDWFIAGMDLPQGSITYHLKMEYWTLLDCRVLTHAPEWDGHTSHDVLERLKKWLHVTLQE